MRPLDDRVGLDEATARGLRERVAGEPTLVEVLASLARAGDRVVDVIVQDEFTHDFVASFGALYLVYDTT